MVCQAEWLVETAIQRAVYEVYGYKDIHVFFTPVQHHQTSHHQRATPSTKPLHRQMSTPSNGTETGNEICLIFDM